MFAKRQFGQEAENLNVLAHSPGLIVPYLMGSRLAQAKTDLDLETKSLAMHLVAARNGCAWCIDFGLAQAVKDGVPMEKMVAVLDYATDPRFSPAQRAALAFADEVTENHGHASDERFNALKPHFSDREIVELTVSIAIEDFFNRTNGPLGIESQNFCAMPAAFQARDLEAAPVRLEAGTQP
jgi:AhpD family alkylhydroperoxidase